MKIDTDELLSIGEAATLRGVSHQAISDLVRMRRVRTVSIRGRPYILLKDIEAYTPGKRGRRPKEKPKSHGKKKARES
jgi:hypothetical protein